GSILERDLLRRSLEGVKTLYHTVALVPIAKAGDEFIRVNVDGTRLVLEEACAAGVEKVVHLSSSAILGTPAMPISDDAPYRPIGPYGKSKMLGEMVCKEFAESGKLDISLVRPRTVIGPGRLGIFQILFDWISDGANVFIIGKGNNKIQFLHAADLAEACIAAGRHKGPITFNVGATEFTTLRGDLESLCKHAGTKSKVKSLPVLPTITALKLFDVTRLSPLAPWHYLTYHKDFYFDNHNAHTLLEWQPKYSNIESLIESYDWYIAHKQEINTKYAVSHRFALKQRILSLLKKIS
ncbi:NAD-dependent epimerase/dehydratase family protein, partial [Acidobacteriota bacterium]